MKNTSLNTKILVHPPIHLSTHHLPTHSSIYLPIHPPTHSSVRSPTHPLTHSSISRLVHPWLTQQLSRYQEVCQKNRQTPPSPQLLPRPPSLEQPPHNRHFTQKPSPESRKQPEGAQLCKGPLLTVHSKQCGKSLSIVCRRGKSQLAEEACHPSSRQSSLAGRSWASEKGILSPQPAAISG